MALVSFSLRRALCLRLRPPVNYSWFLSRAGCCHGNVRCLSYGSTVSNTQNQKWSYTYGLPKTPLLGITVGKLLQMQTESIPDREAAVFYQDGERLTFEQLLTQADQLAAGLLSLGLKRGDRVGIWGPNNREWVVTQYASARAGLILVNLNPTYLKNELEYSLKKVGCKALISATGHKGLDYYETLYNLIPELASSPTGSIKSHLLPDLKTLIMMGKEKYRGTFNFDNILEAASSAEVKAIFDIQNVIQFDEPVNIQFTSVRN